MSREVIETDSSSSGSNNFQNPIHWDKLPEKEIAEETLKFYFAKLGIILKTHLYIFQKEFLTYFLNISCDFLRTRFRILFMFKKWDCYLNYSEIQKHYCTTRERQARPIAITKILPKFVKVKFLARSKKQFMSLKKQYIIWLNWILAAYNNFDFRMASKKS